MGVDSMHCMVFLSELQPEARPAKSVEPQKKGESTSIAECPEGAQGDGGAAEAYLQAPTLPELF